MGIATVGYSIFRDLDLDETGIAVKASPAMVFGWVIHNSATDGTTIFVKLYNQATAADENDTPVLTLPVEPDFPAQIMEFSRGIIFDTGLSARCTTAQADNSTAGATTCTIDLLYV